MVGLVSPDPMMASSRAEGATPPIVPRGRWSTSADRSRNHRGRGAGPGQRAENGRRMLGDPGLHAARVGAVVEDAVRAVVGGVVDGRVQVVGAAGGDGD